MLLVPVSFLVPCNVLFEDQPSWGSIGGQPVTVYECISLAASILLIVLGTQMRRFLLALGGLTGFGILVARVTERHFEENLSWPLALLVLGGTAMVTGGVVAWIRERRVRSQGGS